VACPDFRLENAEETARLAGQGALAVQCAAQNIRVNTLSPGGVETDRLLRSHRHRRTQERRARVMRNVECLLRVESRHLTEALRHLR